ncbi:hypothetical protein BJB45_06735 [Halomonas huangheensis]|uniref:HTH gntR-type domain-containing protein n=2 Tax=Halomonas huangheensis TaxID=1178482 RepID=W1N3D5_9GAMM|nr:hypothetical protein BJB45_06735 [Halomonas huangheensis]
MPRYRQIAEGIGNAITAGQLKAGERLPPQRHLADALGVTVGTITRAYNEAQQRGWVQSRVGSGTYVHGDETSGSDFTLLTHESADGDNPSGMIDMSLSFAPYHSWRHDSLREALQSICHDPAAIAMASSYQADIGNLAHRQALGAWLEHLGFPTSGSLVVTQGGQHGLDLCLRTLTRPGELVAADALTYPGFNAAVRHAYLKPVGIPLDTEGMDVDALARLCQRQVPRLVYVTPDQNNPTSISMSEERREQLTALARQHDFWLLEDHVQYLPREDRGTSLLELAPERTLHVFSTSKVLSGGLRTGTLQVPDRVSQRIASSLRAETWMAPPLMVEATCRWITSPNADELIAWQTSEQQYRQQRAFERLARYHPQGQLRGSNVWLPLPEGRRSSEVHALLDSAGVRVSTPEPFCTGSEPAPQAIRLCVGAPRTREQLDRALDIILEVLESGDTSPWNTL